MNNYQNMSEEAKRLCAYLESQEEMADDAGDIKRSLHFYQCRLIVLMANGWDYTMAMGGVLSASGSGAGRRDTGRLVGAGGRDTGAGRIVLRQMGAAWAAFFCCYCQNNR